MGKILLDSLGAKITIDTDEHDRLYSLFDQMGIYCHFPDVKVSNVSFCEDYNIHYTNNSERNFYYDGNNVVVNYPMDEINDGHSLLYLAGPLIEKQRQERKNLTCHAACLSKNGEAVLLLGPKGSGKTLMTLNMLINGYSLIANDISVIDYSLKDALYALGGSKFINLRRYVIEKELPEFADDLVVDSEYDYYDNIILDPNTVGFSIEKNRVPITRAYILNVNNNFNSLELSMGNSLISKLYLSEDFSRYIRGSAFHFINSQSGNVEGYIPSMDNAELCFQRAQLIEFMINQLPIENLCGNATTVKKFLLRK